MRRSNVCLPRPAESRSANCARTAARMLLQAPMVLPMTSARASSSVCLIFSPPGTSPTPVWPELSVRMTIFRVKNGACAPLRLSSMLSRPATGMTCIAVMVGAPEKPEPTDCWINLSSRRQASFRPAAPLLFGCFQPARHGAWQLGDQRRNFGDLGLVQIRQRRAHRTGVAADDLHARLDHRDSIPLFAVADRDQRQDEILQTGLDRRMVAATDGGVEGGSEFRHEVEHRGRIG